VQPAVPNLSTDRDRGPRALAKSMRAYAAAAKHASANCHDRSLVARLGRGERRLVFVVGSPRSGTTFLGRTVGAVPGFADLSEVTALKAAIPRLAGLPPTQAGEQVERILERVRHLALVHTLRSVEQTPEASFVLAGAFLAYPQARALHVVRDGRDVVCSLLERGWLKSERIGQDDARHAFGAQARFWVEPERSEEFEQASDATRAAWAWRRYVETVRTIADERVLEFRYEQMINERESTAKAIATHLDADPAAVGAGLAKAFDRSIGRYRQDLTPGQLDDVEREAGPLLHELGYS
jgi:hypothetical protein